MTRVFLVATTAAAALVLPVGVAHAAEQSDSAGGVTATLIYSVKDGDWREWHNLALTVERDGEEVYAERVVVDGCEVPHCAPINQHGDPDAVRVIDVTGDGEPEVLLDLYTGGAHCCWVTQVLRLRGDAYEEAEAFWGDTGYRLADVDRDGTREFATADARFAYAFAPFAGSAFPVRYVRLTQSGFRDVTARFRPQVRRDADRWLRIYRGARDEEGGALGPLAAWAADQYRLGRRAAVRRYLERELKAGRLQGIDGWPQKRAFIRALQDQLAKWDY